MSKVTRSLRSRDVQVATSLASRFVHIVGGSAALCSYRAMPPSFRTLKGPIVVLSRVALRVARSLFAREYVF